MEHRILLVDDEPANLHLLEKMLAPTGWRTALAKDGREALALADKTPFDLVLLDVRMPDLDGIDVLTHLRARPDWVPVILVTASNTREDRIRGAEAGADDFLEKPIDLPVLLARVRTLLKLKETREQLAQRHQALQRTLEREQELTGFIAHDLKNPLAVMATNIAFVKRQLAPGSTAAEALGDAADAAQQMLRLIDSLLAVRNDDHLAPLVDRVVLERLLDELCHAHRREADERGVALDHGVAPGLELNADGFLLRRVLDNLVENALRYTPAGGRIRVAAKRGAGPVLTVSNSGTPIPPEHRERIFDKFARLDPTEHRAGRGLGLYFARRVVEAHGGTIRVVEDPEWPTRFVIELPASAEAAP